MSYIIEYDNFEIIDIPEAIRASAAIDNQQNLYHSLDHGFYRDTQNGFVIISTQIENAEQNKQAINIVQESIISFFSKKTHKRPHLAVHEALLYANRELYMSATQNEKLKGLKLSCLVILIREKLVYYAYAGKANFFIKSEEKLSRITPGKIQNENDILEEAGYINSSEINPDLEIVVCKQPYLPKTNDYIFICSDEYVKESDRYVKEVIDKNPNLQKTAVEFAQYSLNQHNLKARLTFLLLRFNIKGGKHTLAGSFEYQYGNFIGKTIAFITSLPVLVTLALSVIFLIWYLS